MAKSNNNLAGVSIEYRSSPWSSYGRYETTKNLDSWTKISFTCPIASKTGVGVKIDTTRAAAVSSTIYLTDFILINLTKHFGAGNEPSSAWCDKNISYFSSTTTVSADTFEISPDTLQDGDILEFYTTNKAETIHLPKGIYKFECYGAKGGCNRNDSSAYGVGGSGGYSVGTVKLKDKLTQLFIYPGGAGYEADSSTATCGGFNGGGTAKYSAGSGGGASDIRIGTDSLYARVIVAGGGGGAQGRGSTSYKASGGAGGGLSGQYGGYYGTLVEDTTNGGPGGTQTAGGGVVSSTYGNTAGSFGIGGNGGYRSSTYGGTGAGGGGWYGGGTGYNYYSGGGGGSGYVYTSETASNYPSGCLLNSNYYLTDAQTVAGTSSFPIRDGFEAVGNEAQGLVRITVIKLSKVPIRVKTTSNTWKEAVSAWVKVNSTTWKELASLKTIRVPNGYTALEYIESSGTQYINTGFKATNNTKMILDAELTYGSSWIMIAGSYDSGAYYSWWAKASQLYSYYASSNQNMAGPTQRTKLIADKNNWSYDANTLSLTNTSFTATNPIYLFSVSNGGSYANASMKLYSCQIYDNGTLVREF